MQIAFSPVRMDESLSVSRTGDVLTINGEAVDLATYAGGCDWIVGLPEAGPDGWTVTLILPCGPDAPDEARFPAAVALTGDGAVPLPGDEDQP